MHRTGPIFFTVLALGFAGCSGRVLERAPRDTGHRDAGTPSAPPRADGGTASKPHVDGGTPSTPPRITPTAVAEAGPPPTTEPGGTVPRPPADAGPEPNPACPDVYSGGVPDRGGPGRDGIAALRNRVLMSRGAFQQYTAVHHDTYSYTRFLETRAGSACSMVVQVTTGAVSSVTVSQLDAVTSRWTTGTYSPHDPKASSCFKPLTMYELYDECLTKVLCRDPRTNFLDVHVDARGFLVQCGYDPDGCSDHCYRGLEAIVLTADGKDWTDTVPGCCPISPAPACCMEYGGWGPNCRTRCDVGPSASAPGWHIAISSEGCAEWVEPPEGTYDPGKSPAGDAGCCGCALPDASAVAPGMRDGATP